MAFSPVTSTKKGSIAAVIVGVSTLISSLVCGAVGIPEDLKPQVTGVIASILSGGSIAIINAIKNRKK